jgi:DNA-binding transcriptional regulator YhcF (GntR family)
LLDVTIQKTGSVSIHQQLVTQISLQIAAGVLPAGSRLPSVRALSKRLGVHHNTCLAVYAELARLGLTVNKRGSGVTVADWAEPATQSRTEEGLEGLELRQLIRLFLRLVREKGYSRQDIRLALKLALAEQRLEASARTVVYVDSNADILPLFQAELETALGQPVQAVPLSAVTPQPTETSASPCYLVSRYHVRALRERLPDSASIWVMEVDAADTERELLRRLPVGALVGVVSRSQVVLEMARTIIEGLRGEEILLQTLLWQEDEALLAESIRHASLILCDVTCAEPLMRLTRKAIQVFRLIPDDELARIHAFVRETAGGVGLKQEGEPS